MISSQFILERLMTIPGILLGFVLHEFAHAKMADRLGDPTPRAQGRITLDPRAHIDIIGFIMIIVFYFGWAKPVQTNPRYYKNIRRDDILVSIAGPFMNLTIAIVFLVLNKIIYLSGLFSANQVLYSNILMLLDNTAHINIVLFVLNLLPIPMFDGYHVIANLFNTWKYRFFNFIEQYGMIIFMLLVFSRVLNKILNPLVSGLYFFLTNLIY